MNVFVAEEDKRETCGSGISEPTLQNCAGHLPIESMLYGVCMFRVHMLSAV